MQKILAILFVFISASSAVLAEYGEGQQHAQLLTVPPPTITYITAEDTKVSDYTCKEIATLRVQYFKANDTPFASLLVHGKELLFVRTIAASGERYVSGPYVWWVKGDHGFLEDMTAPKARRILYSHCEQQF